jgi:hypothetical protein
MTLNYDNFAEQYNTYRRPDPRIAEMIWKHLSGAVRILNVGAGIGSYEPIDREVIALEPSEKMIALRPKTAAPAVQGYAEQIPFKDNEFDAAMALLTIHHWTDLPHGLGEMMRVANGKIVLMTWIDQEPHFWLEDYIPQLRDADYSLFPSVTELEEMLGPITAEPVPVPHNCTDGFFGAYWRRPEAYLDAKVRDAISAFARIESNELNEGLTRLESDVSSGVWKIKYAHLLDKNSLDLGYRLVTRG